MACRRHQEAHRRSGVHRRGEALSPRSSSSEDPPGSRVPSASPRAAGLQVPARGAAARRRAGERNAEGQWAAADLRAWRGRRGSRCRGRQARPRDGIAQDARHRRQPVERRAAFGLYNRWGQMLQRRWFQPPRGNGEGRDHSCHRQEPHARSGQAEPHQERKQAQSRLDSARVVGPREAEVALHDPVGAPSRQQLAPNEQPLQLAAPSGSHPPRIRPLLKPRRRAVRVRVREAAASRATCGLPPPARAPRQLTAPHAGQLCRRAPSLALSRCPSAAGDTRGPQKPGPGGRWPARKMRAVWVFLL